MALKRNLTATEPAEMLQIISSAYQQALSFYNMAEEQKLIAKPRKSPKYYRIEYLTESPRRSIFTIQCNESEWLIKAPLVYLCNYDDKLKDCSPDVLAVLSSTRECIQCSSRCSQGAHFTLENQHRIVCVSDEHSFQNLSEHGWADLRMLLKCEIDFLTKDNE